MLGVLAHRPALQDQADLERRAAAWEGGAAGVGGRDGVVEEGWGCGERRWRGLWSSPEGVSCLPRRDSCCRPWARRAFSQCVLKVRFLEKRGHRAEPKTDLNPKP